MEGDRTIKESYDAVCKASKENTTSKLVLDYSKFDEVTASKLRLTISRVLGERRRELWNTISGAK